MRKDTAATAALTDMSNEHHLVAQLREAMARKDIATMGRMLELLGTIQSELVMGRSVIDRVGPTRSDPNAGGAQAKAYVPLTRPLPASAPANKPITRAGR